DVILVGGVGGVIARPSAIADVEVERTIDVAADNLRRVLCARQENRRRQLQVAKRERRRLVDGKQEQIDLNVNFQLDFNGAGAGGGEADAKPRSGERDPESADADVGAAFKEEGVEAGAQIVGRGDVDIKIARQAEIVAAELQPAVDADVEVAVGIDPAVA